MISLNYYLHDPIRIEMRVKTMNALAVSQWSSQSNNFCMNPGRMSHQIISSINPRGTQGWDVFNSESVKLFI